MKKRVKISVFKYSDHYTYFSAIILIVFLILLIIFLHKNTIENQLERDLLIGVATVFAISFVFTVVDKIRKYYVIQKPLNKILEATEQVTNGDFTTRIPVTNSKKPNEYDIIFENFNRMVAELGNTETLKLDFLSNVSHELKTPLSVISNYSVLLQSDSITDEEKKEYANHIYVTTKELSNLINNILKLSKLENQEIPPNISRFNVSESVSMCALKYADACEEKEIELDIDLDDSIVVQSDEELIQIVWHNLFSNAVKFTPNGGKISISLKQYDDIIVFEISDTGCGIPESVGNRIFDKFYQADESHASKGNGLGLALAKRVVDILGGDISYQSELGRGTSFRVTLNNNIKN